MLTGLGQLIYTSFPGTGFMALASDQVPESVQSYFLNKIVIEHWNSYHNNPRGMQAVYLHQPTLESCIFGWLYCDEIDEYGRSIPYFIGYYLPEALDEDRLSQILACLQKGPLGLCDRRRTPCQSINSITLSSIQSYTAVRRGLKISNKVCEVVYGALDQKEPIFMVEFSNDTQSHFLNNNNEQQPVQLDDLETLQPGELKSNTAAGPSLASSTDVMGRILEALLDKPLGVQSAVLLSPEGQPIIPPVGMDMNSASILAGSMLSLAKKTSEELHWQEIEKVCLQGKEGYVILVQCAPETFLLIQAGKTLPGLLDGVINRTAQQLQAVLQSNVESTTTLREQIKVLAERNGASFIVA